MTCQSQPRMRQINCTNFPLVVFASTVALIAGCSSGGSAGEPLGPPGKTAAPRPSASASETLGPEISTAQSRFYAAYQRAFGQPQDASAAKPLLDTYVPSAAARQQVSDRLAQFAKEGWAVRPGRAGYYVVRGVKAADVDGQHRALALICTYDDGVVYDAIRTAPDGSRIVIDDSVSSVATTFTWVQQIDGGWKLLGGQVTQTWKGVNRCPPR